MRRLQVATTSRRRVPRRGGPRPLILPMRRFLLLTCMADDCTPPCRPAHRGREPATRSRVTAPANTFIVAWPGPNVDRYHALLRQTLRIDSTVRRRTRWPACASGGIDRSPRRPAARRAAACRAGAGLAADRSGCSSPGPAARASPPTFHLALTLSHVPPSRSATTPSCPWRPPPDASRPPGRRRAAPRAGPRAGPSTDPQCPRVAGRRTVARHSRRPYPQQRDADRRHTRGPRLLDGTRATLPACRLPCSRRCRTSAPAGCGRGGSTRPAHPEGRLAEPSRRRSTLGG